MQFLFSLLFLIHQPEYLRIQRCQVINHNDAVMSDGKNIGPMALSYVQIKRHRNENKNFLCSRYLVYKGMVLRRLD